MSSTLDIGEAPDRPSTPSTQSEASHASNELSRPRVVRPEDLEDGEGNPNAVSPEAVLEPSWDDAPQPTWDEAPDDSGWGVKSSEADWGACAGDNTGAKEKVASKPKKSGASKEPKAPKDDEAGTPTKSKGVTYVRPEGPRKEKMSTEQLAAVMARMKLQNDRIREQRERIEADEDAFNIQLAAEREKQAKMREEQRAHEAAQRQIQADLNAEREENAKRKLARMAQREWDSNKKDRPSGKDQRSKGRGNHQSNADNDAWGAPNASNLVVDDAWDSSNREEAENVWAADDQPNDKEGTRGNKSAPKSGSKSAPKSKSKKNSNPPKQKDQDEPPRLPELSLSTTGNNDIIDEWAAHNAANAPDW